ncbi:MAG TPA: hypothetical protein PLF81_08105 [Candidatus Anammoximicrobium sp.]|nr:hypothetical protein [Candidatus Anammoximicrobium sp.]HPM80647.1 hypothetical protein [Candidatus Anammoximicrobium sp.]
MSGLDSRPPLKGVIYEGNSAVGGVVLTSPDEAFVQEFNREYARLGLRVEAHQPPVDAGPKRAAVPPAK